MGCTFYILVLRSQRHILVWNQIHQNLCLAVGGDMEEPPKNLFNIAKSHGVHELNACAETKPIIILFSTKICDIFVGGPSSTLSEFITRMNSF